LGKQQELIALIAMLGLRGAIIAILNGPDDLVGHHSTKPLADQVCHNMIPNRSRMGPVARFCGAQGVKCYRFAPGRLASSLRIFAATFEVWLEPGDRTHDG
jgi:hypothetical protein